MPNLIDNYSIQESRLAQLIELAREGSDEAVADIWHEFAIDVRPMRD